MPKEELSATYASPGLRFGIFLEEYPNGTYRFTLMKGTELDPPVPIEFGGDQDFVVCVLDKADGTPLVTGYKDIPLQVERWVDNNGRRAKQMVDFERTPDTWQVLCTKALGRALKRAGLADDTRDLKAIILWRQRRLELAAIERGVILTPLAIGMSSDKPDDIDNAGTPDRYGDQDRDPEDPSQNDAVDAEMVDVMKLAWAKDASDLMIGYPESVVHEIFALANQRRIDVTAPAQHMGTLLTIIRAKRPANLATPEPEVTPPDEPPPPSAPATSQMPPAPPQAPPTRPPPRQAQLAADVGR